MKIEVKQDKPVIPPKIVVIELSEHEAVCLRTIAGRLSVNDIKIKLDAMYFTPKCSAQEIFTVLKNLYDGIDCGKEA